MKAIYRGRMTVLYRRAAPTKIKFEGNTYLKIKETSHVFGNEANHLVVVVVSSRLATFMRKVVYTTFLYKKNKT